jgi:hypothetical protein
MMIFFKIITIITMKVKNLKNLAETKKSQKLNVKQLSKVVDGTWFEDDEEFVGQANSIKGR